MEKKKEREICGGEKKQVISAKTFLSFTFRVTFLPL